MSSGLRFAYSTINWGDTPDMPAALREIEQAGWRAVELFAHSLDWLGPVSRMKELLGDLTVATMFAFISVPTDPKERVRLEQQIAYAAELGASHYGLVGGNRLRWRPPTDAEYTGLATACEELAIFGAERGLTVSYHPHVACTIETEEEIDRLMHETKVLTLCLDASHIALVDEDPVAHLRKYRERTGYIHLKDWARGAFVEMGEGTLGIDFGAVLAELEAQEFASWVVVEQSRSNVSPLRSAEINAAHLRKLGYRPEERGS